MIVRDRHAVVRGHRLTAGSGDLMQFASRSRDHF
jgi:hypothetical protein